LREMNITYMVLHDRLVAYVVVEPSVSMTEWGRYTYGIEADEEVEVVATNMLMLVTVAEMQNAP